MASEDVRVDAMPDSASVISIAPVGTVLPTDISTELDPAFLSVGIIGSDGIGIDPSSSTNDVEDMNGNVVLTLESGNKSEIGFPMLETQDVSLGLYHGSANVSRASGATGAPDVITVQGGSTIKEHVSAVIDTISMGTYHKRTVVADAKVTAREGIKMKGTDATMRSVTLSTFPTDATGVTYVSYIEVPPVGATT